MKWFVKAGDVVAEHQPIAAILTDKAEVEIPSPKAGKILKLYGKPGEKIKVHSPLVSIHVAGGGEAAAPAEEAPAKAPSKAISAKEASAEGTHDAKGKITPVAAPKAPAAASAAAPTSGGFVFNLPDLGEGLVEGELVRWFVKEGDKVTEHQPLAVVLTDKAEVEVPSPKAGVVAKLHGKPGSKVLVHQPLVSFSNVSGGSVEASSHSVAVGVSVSVPDSKAAAAPAVPRPSRPASEVLATHGPPSGERTGHRFIPGSRNRPQRTRSRDRPRGLLRRRARNGQRDARGTSACRLARGEPRDGSRNGPGGTRVGGGRAGFGACGAYGNGTTTGTRDRIHDLLRLSAGIHTPHS